MKRQQIDVYLTATLLQLTLYRLYDQVHINVNDVDIQLVEIGTNLIRLLLLVVDITSQEENLYN